MATLFTSCEILFYNPYWYCISILYILCWYFDIPYWYCKSPAGGHLIHIMWDSLLWGERQAGYSYAHTPNRGYALNDYYQQLLFPPIKGILSWINDIATIWIYIQSKKNKEHKVSLIKVMSIVFLHLLDSEKNCINCGFSWQLI